VRVSPTTVNEPSEGSPASTLVPFRSLIVSNFQNFDLCRRKIRWLPVAMFLISGQISCLYDPECFDDKRSSRNGGVSWSLTRVMHWVIQPSDASPRSNKESAIRQEVGGEISVHSFGRLR